MELKRVVVTGMGAITPLGNDVETTWENAKAGVSGAGPITHFDASLFKTQFACEVKGFNAEDHFDRKKSRQLDLYAQYALVAARQAVADAGLETAAEEGKVDKNRVGVIVAAGIGGLHTFEEEAVIPVINDLSLYLYKGSKIAGKLDGLKGLVNSFDFCGAADILEELRKEWEDA